MAGKLPVADFLGWVTVQLTKKGKLINPSIFLLEAANTFNDSNRFLHYIRPY